ncbi:MAG: hypothetical protein AB1611_19315 [bacterium]
MAFWKPKKNNNIEETGGRLLSFNTDVLNPHEKQKLFSEIDKRSGFTAYHGHVEHGYSLKSVTDPERCPRCHAPTERHYGNFIYTTQTALRIMHAPAGFFVQNAQR